MRIWLGKLYVCPTTHKLSKENINIALRTLGRSTLWRRAGPYL